MKSGVFVKKEKVWEIEMLEKELTDDRSFSVRCGNLVVGATFTNSEADLCDWLRSTRPIRRNVTEIVGICLLRGLPRGLSRCLKGPKTHPSHMSNPIQFMAVCFNDSDVLLYQHQPNWLYARPKKIKELRDLLADKKISVAGVGLKKDLEALENDWGISIQNTIEVGGGNNVEDACKAGLGLNVGKKPARLVDLDWGSRGVGRDEDAMVYAVRDAFLCRELGLKLMMKV